MRGGKAKALVTGMKFNGCARCGRRPMTTAETAHFHIAHIDAVRKDETGISREYSVAYWADHGATCEEIIAHLIISEILCEDCHSQDSGLAQAQRRQPGQLSFEAESWIRETTATW